MTSRPEIMVGISPPQGVVLEALRDGPKYFSSARSATWVKDDVIYGVWTIPISLERRGLIKRRDDGKYESLPRQAALGIHIGVRTQMEKHVEALIKKAAEQNDAAQAMQFAQAACNAANAMCALKTEKTMK